MPSEALRSIMRFVGTKFSWHDEQCNLAEFSAYVARDVSAHIDFAAEARVKPPTKAEKERCDEDEEASSEPDGDEANDLSFRIDDIGGAGLDENGTVASAIVDAGGSRWLVAKAVPSTECRVGSLAKIWELCKRSKARVST